MWHIHTITTLDNLSESFSAMTVIKWLDADVWKVVALCICEYMYASIAS